MAISITPVPTIEYTLPFPGLLPTHPLYFAKNIRDKIMLVFATNKVKKAHLLLLFADKHMMMGKTLWEEGDKEVAVKTLVKSQKYLSEGLLELAQLAKTKSMPPGLLDKFELADKKYLEIIINLISKTKVKEEEEMLQKVKDLFNLALAQTASIKSL